MRLRTLLVLAGTAALAGGGAYVALAARGVDEPSNPTIVAAPQGPTNDRSASFSYTSREPVSFLCSLDRGAFVPCGSGTSGATTYPGPLADGGHIFAVEGERGGATGPARSWSWRVDTVPPPAPWFKRTPADPSTETSARFDYADAKSFAYECRLDGGAYASCGHHITYDDVLSGRHSFCVRAVDTAGNRSQATCFSWSVAVGTTSFSISGSTPAGEKLYPGGDPVPIDLVFTNGNQSPVRIESVTVSVTGTSAPGCPVDGFRVVQQLRATPTVPAGATRSLDDLGVPQSRWPQLQMAAAGNQDACQNATVDLAFSGTASG